MFFRISKRENFLQTNSNFSIPGWEGKQLIGHMAVEHRLINASGRKVHIFGVVDLCVSKAFQHKKIASTLLNNLEKLGKNIILILSF